MKFDLKKSVSVLAFAALGFVFADKAAMATTPLVLACYPGAPEDFFRAEIIPRFEKAFDAKVTYVTSNSPATIAKLQAQKNDPQIDVACIDDGPLVQAKGMGLLQPTDPSKLPNLKDIQQVSQFPDHIGVGWSLFRLGIAYNPDIFKQKNLPPLSSWLDLGRPDLKGHVVVNSISISYTPILLTMLAHAKGGDDHHIDPGFAAMQDIRQNIFTYDTTADLTPYFQQSEAWVGVWTDSETYSYVQRTHLPLKFVFPKEGTTAIQTTASVVKGAKHPELAEQFLNYLIGREAQELIAQKLGWMPVNKSAELPSDMAAVITSPPGSGDNMMSLDWTYLGQQRPAWTERWNKEVETQ